MRKLEAEIKRLEAEYNMFFAGRLPRLPWETRARVDALVKATTALHIQNTADRFRFQTLQTRFATFSELWERQLKAQRAGGRPARRARRRRRATPAPRRAAAASRRPSRRAPPRPSGRCTWRFARSGRRGRHA